MAAIDNAHALIVGIAGYHSVRRLPQSVINDAKAIHATLTDPGLCGYPPAQVQLLYDDKATLAALRAGLQELAANTSDDASVFIYFSGHGGRIAAGPYAGEYLVPVDANAGDDAGMAVSCLSGAEFSAALHAIPARRLVVAFDCCHAGGIGEPKKLDGVALAPLTDDYYETLKSGRGRVIFASSRSDELSWVLEGATNSLFTNHLLGGLRGGANGAGGVIRIFDVFDYLQPRVTQDRPDQHPIFKAEIEENFPIALYKGGAKEVAPAPAPKDHYEYDAFVSYSDSKADRQHVRGLVKGLETQGFRIAVDYHAPLGIPKITYAENAVTNSRYTLVVLSPAYVSSGLAEFQSLLAQHLGQEQSQYRVVPLLIEECTPRLGLRILPILDLIDEEEKAANLARLADYLSQPPASLRQPG